MFTNITEEDIRVHCPEYAPMTIAMMNKLSPLKINNSVNPLNPYVQRRTAPSSINQFVKTSGYQFNSLTQSNRLRESLVERIEATDVLPLAERIEEEKGVDDELDELYRKPAPGELSMQEIDEQLEILELTLTNENLSGEELNNVLLTMEYYERLKEEQGERNVRDFGQGSVSKEQYLSMSDAQLGEELRKSRETMQDIIEEPEPKKKVKIRLRKRDREAYQTALSKESSVAELPDVPKSRAAELPDVPKSRVVIPAQGIQPLPIPGGQRLSASEMREKALKNEELEEQRKRLEALQKRTSTLGPIPRPP